MADYNLGTARGVIEIEYNGNGVTQATRDMRGVGAASEDAATRYNKSAGALAKGGAVIAGGLALAVKSAADFEKQLSNVAAVSGATEAEMEQVRSKALQLGKDTQFSASESAQAIEELVKAGMTVGDVMNGAADATVALAAAGEVSMPEAATIASNAMNQFGLAAKEMPGVADAIAGAANASAIDVREFGYSLSQVGAVANLAGANFKDTATAIALMGNAGIKGSDAGTSLKSMLNNLQPTTEKQKELMYELGITTRDGANHFYDAAGNLKSLADVSGILQTALKGQTKQQKQATLETLFGSDAIRAAAVLADNGAKGFDKMATSMGKVTAADVAATKMDNLAGSVEQLKGSLETLMILIGTPLLNGIRMIVDGFTGFLNMVLSIPGPVLEAVTVFATMLSAGLLLAAGFLKMRAAIIAFRAGAMLLTGPILLVVAAIAALVAAFVYFYKTNAQFRAFVQKMGAVIKDAIGAAVAWLVPKLQELGKWLMDTFQKALPYIQRFKGVILAVMAVVAVAILGPIAAIAALVAAFVYFYRRSEGFRSVIQSIVGFLKELAGVFMDDVLPVIKQVAGEALGALIGAFRKIAPEVQPMIAAVKDLAGSLIGFFQTIMGSPAMGFLINVLQILADVIMSTIIPLMVRLGGIFFKVWVGVIGNAVRMAMGILRNVIGIISGIIKVITGVLTGDFGKAWEGVKQIFRGAVGVIGSILRGMIGIVGTIAKGIGSALVAGVKAIPGMLRGLGSLFLAAGRFIIDQFVQGIKNAAGLISGLAGNIWDFVRGLLNGAIGTINSALEFTINPPGPGSVSVNPPDIPQLATGGVLTAPTMAWIAEAGQDEAVIPLRDLWRQMDRVYRAGRTALEDPESRSRGRGAGSGTMGQPGRSRLVEGRLYIDASGRAYIKGIAEDVADGNERFATTHRRQGGR